MAGCSTPDRPERNSTAAGGAEPAAGPAYGICDPRAQAAGGNRGMSAAARARAGQKAAP